MNEAENLSLILRWQNGIWCAIGHQVTWFAIHLSLSRPATQPNLSVVLLSISLEKILCITSHSRYDLFTGTAFFFSFLRYQCSSDLRLQMCLKEPGYLSAGSALLPVDRKKKMFCLHWHHIREK